MDGFDCKSCGARNAPDTPFCWRCYAPFSRGPRATGASATLGIAGRSRAPAGFAAPIPGPAAGSSSSRLRGLALGGALAAAVAGGWLAWTALSGGFDFPSSVGGFERLDSKTADRAEEALSAVGGVAGIEMEAAFYGASAQPVYSVMAIEPPEGMETPEELLASFSAGASATGAVASGHTGFTCLPYRDTGAGCVWAVDGRYIGVFGFGVSVEELDPVARDVRAQTG